MAVQKDLLTKSVFFILCGFAIINHGLSQDDTDYTANVKIEELKTSKDINYFEVENKQSMIFYTLQELDKSKKVYVIDYYFDKSGKKKQIGKHLLCDELTTKKVSSELRHKILDTFLFPKQNRCPIKIDKVREPPSKELSFNYADSSVSCDAPWKYHMELVSLYRAKDPLVTLTVSLTMEKKKECASG